MGKIEINLTGIVPGYEDYHSEVYLDGEKAGECHYDKRQRKYIAGVNGRKFYRDSIASMQRCLENNYAMLKAREAKND